MKQPCVYMLASRRNGTLYVGVTSNLVQRVWQHKNDLVEGFTKRYGVHTLVWYEIHEVMESAITREKAVKRWKRTGRLSWSKGTIRRGAICTMTWFDAGGAEMLDRYRAIPASIRDTECCVGLVDLALDVHKDAGFLLSQE